MCEKRVTENQRPKTQNPRQCSTGKHLQKTYAFYIDYIYKYMFRGGGLVLNTWA